MSRLILFSGGVESTALLTMSRPDDVVLTINPSFASEVETYRRDLSEQIADHFGRTVQYASITASVDPAPFQFVHQMRAFISVCNLWVAKDTRITEVWCGRNSAEPGEKLRPFIEQMMQAWAVLHPNVAFLHPLDHLSKREQLALIPEAVRPLISSCMHHRWCGTCKKCLEWLPLSESSPVTTSA